HPSDHTISIDYRDRRSVNYLDHSHRYRPHILPLLRRIQALLHRQTVNTQKNLAKKFKSNLDKTIRSDFGHQTPCALS
ncbi:MAG: hypothetical protein ACLQVF_04855, partial [Isosphaeraceae bacterium]